MSRVELLAILAGTVTGVLVGAAMVATRYVIGQTDPASLALLRYGIGTLGLIPPLLLIRRVKFAGRDLIPIALLGIGRDLASAKDTSSRRPSSHSRSRRHFRLWERVRLRAPSRLG